MTVFQNIYWVFLVLGTLVGIVVIGYMFWNAYRYRDGNGKEYDDAKDEPKLGEIPKGGGKGRKLFLSFGLSAIIVISLIVWTYGTLLFVEGQDTGQPSADVGVDNEDPVVVKSTGYRFNWTFEYQNGKETNGRLVVPEGRVVQLRVTSDDVFHNLGIPKYRVKTDAIPGETTRSWFVAEDPGRYRIICYELCGQGHSGMIAYLHVVPQEEYDQFVNNESSLSEVTASDDESGRLAAAR